MAKTWTWEGTNFSYELKETAFNAISRKTTLRFTVTRKSTFTTTGRYYARLWYSDINIGGDKSVEIPFEIKSGDTETQVGTSLFTVNYGSSSANMTLAGAYPFILGTYAAGTYVVESLELEAENCELTPLPTDLANAAPILSASSVNFGTKVTITTRDTSSASLKYDLAYSIGRASGNIGTNLAAGAKEWTVANSLMAQIPSATKGNISILVTAKNSGGDALYTWTLYLEANVPTSVVPTVSTAVSEGATIPSTITGYVQSKSRLTVTHTVAGAYGSTIASCTTTVDGVTYDGRSFTSNIITSAGTVAVKVTVVDSRGRTASKTTNVTVQAYTAPALTSVEAYRCATSGNPEAKANGEYICVKPVGSITPLNSNNAKTCKVFYKKSSASSYTSAAITMNDYELDTEYKIFLADVNSSFDVYVTLADSFSTVKYICPQVTSTGAYIHIPASRDGIGFGTRATETGVLKTSWKVKSNDDIVADADGLPVSLMESSKYLRGYYAARPSTMNLEHIQNGGMINFLSSSAANSSGTKPGGADGHIITFFWDNANATDAQLAVSVGGAVRARGRNANGWLDWHTMLDDKNFKSFFTVAVMEEISVSTSANITVPTISGVTITKTLAKVLKTGKVVEVDYRVTFSNSTGGTQGLSAGYVIGTIPDGYRPSVAIYCTNGSCLIETGGSIKLQSAISVVSSGTTVSFREIYIKS